MKKFLLLFIGIQLSFFQLKAQWVTIPDANFVNKLTQLFPTCMNGNQMDTTCPAILSATQLSTGFTVIATLSGVEYFDSLVYLQCWDAQMQVIPALPGSLKILDCRNNQLTSLPPLPPGLEDLKCQNNLLTALPVLPDSLEYLDCSVNQLINLPALPNNNNFYLWCNNNFLTSLPVLPTSMWGILNCSNNQLTSLPTLPNDLSDLWCHNNQLTSIPPLPPLLYTLYCQNNQLTSLPPLPNLFYDLNCSNNLLTTLPALPVNMSDFIINNNNIPCLEFLPNATTANISNNPLTCVPNQTSYSLGLPLCLDNDVVNNPNNCSSTIDISGNIFTDQNNNCIYNFNDTSINNIAVQLFDDQNNLVAQNYSANGFYSFTLTQTGTYKVKVVTNSYPIAMACAQPDSQMVNSLSLSSAITGVNFPVVCNQNYDVNVQSVGTQGWVFPGQIHTLNTNIADNESWYNLDCDTTTYSGNVIVEIDGPLSYISPAPGALTPQVNGNIFTYSISNFNSLTPTSFGLKLMTDTTAQFNDTICVHVEIAPTPIDADTTNNVYDFCYNVLNSYDPNMKEVYPMDVLPGYDDWFTYTIHFQNTGNAPAFNIRLRDTLDAQLDLSTFEVRGYSHPAAVTLNGNILTVRFNNIMLPDSTTDYEGSMGYFQYRIKPFSNLPNGTQIENTAYIYFDYNAPIVTNTTQNHFDITVPVLTNESNDFEFVIYPNPSNGLFCFKDTKNLKSLEVFNLVGERVLSQGNQKEINLCNFANGIYFAKINGLEVLKLVKE